MYRFFIPLLFVALLPIPGRAQPAGLGNGGKVFTAIQDMTGAEATDQAEIRRSWQSALVRVPTKGQRSKKTTIAELKRDLTDSEIRFPTVIYLHGCSGLWGGSLRRMKLLADKGFLVIAPASFARQKYPKSCDPRTFQGGLYRDTLKMRQQDAGFAIAQARALPFVQKDAVVLMGFSEGAITTATFRAKNSNQRVAARVIEGWTCHSSWPEYHGINAPNREPVLAMVARDDPWFLAPWNRGDCTKALSKRNGSLSIVYGAPNMANRHGLLELTKPKRDLFAFLGRVLGSP